MSSGLPWPTRHNPSGAQMARRSFSRRIRLFLQPAQRELSSGDKKERWTCTRKDDTGGRESGESVAMRRYFYLHGTGSPRFHSFAQCRTVKYRPHKNFGENIGQPSSLQQTRGAHLQYDIEPTGLLCSPNKDSSRFAERKFPECANVPVMHMNAWLQVMLMR